MAQQRKPLITHMFTADPSAHVFNDKLYIYPSHDIPHDGEDNDNGDEYQMEDYHVFRMDNETADPVDCGLALSQYDVPWVSTQMWAPDVAFKNGKYYLVFPARDKDGNFRLGIATSKVPEGPFKPEPECIKGSFSIDPCAFEDEDGKVYMCFGGLWGGQLEKYRTGKFDPNGTEPAKDENAVCPKIALMKDNMLEFAETPRDIVILDENGEPLKAGDEDRRYFEDPSVDVQVPRQVLLHLLDRHHALHRLRCGGQPVRTVHLPGTHPGARARLDHAPLHPGIPRQVVSLLSRLRAVERHQPPSQREVHRAELRRIGKNHNDLPVQVS